VTVSGAVAALSELESRLPRGTDTVKFAKVAEAVVFLDDTQLDKVFLSVSPPPAPLSLSLSFSLSLSPSVSVCAFVSLEFNYDFNR
jgi:hypothetical protein